MAETETPLERGSESIRDWSVSKQCLFSENDESPGDLKISDSGISANGLVGISFYAVKDFPIAIKLGFTFCSPQRLMKSSC